MWEQTFTYPHNSTKSRKKIIGYCQEKDLSFFKSLVLCLKRRCVTRASLRGPSWCSAQMLSSCRKSQCNKRPEQQALLPASCSHAFLTRYGHSPASQEKEYSICGYLTACSDPRHRNFLKCNAQCCLAVTFSPHSVLQPISTVIYLLIVPKLPLYFLTGATCCYVTCFY